MIVFCFLLMKYMPSHVLKKRTYGAGKNLLPHPSKTKFTPPQILYEITCNCHWGKPHPTRLLTRQRLHHEEASKLSFSLDGETGLPLGFGAPPPGLLAVVGESKLCCWQVASPSPPPFVSCLIPFPVSRLQARWIP
jgi:hypothetical protein